MTTRSTPSRLNRQRGASSLFLTVILVMVVMLLAVTASVLSNTQFRLAGNLQFENVAFNLAEGAIASAESWLITGTNAQNDGFKTRSTSTPQLYPQSSLASLDPLTMTWADTNSMAVGGDDNQRYLIAKYVPDTVVMINSSNVICEKIELFTISAIGKSVRGTSKSIQTTKRIVTAVPTKIECVQLEGNS